MRILAGELEALPPTDVRFSTPFRQILHIGSGAGRVEARWAAHWVAQR